MLNYIRFSTRKGENKTLIEIRTGKDGYMQTGCSDRERILSVFLNVRYSLTFFDQKMREEGFYESKTTYGSVERVCPIHMPKTYFPMWLLRDCMIYIWGVSDEGRLYGIGAAGNSDE